MTPLQHIDLLALQHRLTLQKDEGGMVTVLDPVRRKYVRATPEEIVRQLWIIYFLDVVKYNPKLIAVERSFTLNQLVKRFDLVIFNKETQPVLLAEFKSPGTTVGQAVFDQIMEYHMQLNVPYGIVSNGIVHYGFEIDDKTKTLRFLDALPFS